MIIDDEVVCHVEKVLVYLFDLGAVLVIELLAVHVEIE